MRLDCLEADAKCFGYLFVAVAARDQLDHRPFPGAGRQSSLARLLQNSLRDGVLEVGLPGDDGSDRSNEMTNWLRLEDDAACSSFQEVGDQLLDVSFGVDHDLRVWELLADLARRVDAVD